MQLEDLPNDVRIIVEAYKQEMEQLDRFHAFLYTVFSNLVAVLKSK